MKSEKKTCSRFYVSNQYVELNHALGNEKRVARDREQKSERKENKYH